MTNHIPRHVAIVMDGNGRYAESKGQPRYEGHKAGAKTVKDIVSAALDNNVRYLTLYTFSTENWKRSKIEINALMLLLEQYLTQEIHLLYEKGVRLRTIGRTEQLPEKIQKLLRDAMEKTSGNSNLDLILALSYGGRMEVVDACRKIAQKVSNGEIKPDDISEELIGQNLYAPDVPDPELFIRTSNEIRISNFLIWQLSYSEMIFVEKLWPEFTKEDFKACLEHYSLRQRRFGTA
jgi:undecaprenyl diphosphate synthase